MTLNNSAMAVSFVFCFELPIVRARFVGGQNVSASSESCLLREMGRDEKVD